MNFRRVRLMSTVLVAISLNVAAQSGPPVGRWRTTEGFFWEVSFDGKAALTGSVTSCTTAPNALPIADVKFDGSTIGFTCTSGDQRRRLSFTGKVGAEEITLAWNLEVLRGEAIYGRDDDALFGPTRPRQFTVHRIAARGETLDEIVEPGANYNTAEFRLWLPERDVASRAVMVLMPGDNGDSRVFLDDPVLQEFAMKHKLALLGCHLTDKPGLQDVFEQYSNASKGSGDALLTALSSLATRTRHGELGNAPLLMWGMSAGGQFNYEFAGWKPERVLAFIVNKGGIYHSALLPRAAREVPGMFFVGGKDLPSRIATVTGLFAVNRRAGALWALAEEPNAAHVVGRSRDLALKFFEDVLALRLAENGSLKPIPNKTGLVGDPQAKTIRPFSPDSPDDYPSVWLPTERVARAWLAVITEQPFEN